MEALKKNLRFKASEDPNSSFIWNDSSRFTTVLFYEFLGTALVTYAYTFCRADYLARGAAYLIGFVLLFHVTGAHFNPATTLACYLNDKSKGRFKNDDDKLNALKLMGWVILV